MQVVDTINSEHGQQRRRSGSGRLIHVCCICGHEDVWCDGWSSYNSVKELDDGVAIPKFCSAKCKAAGGPQAKNVTEEMKTKARDAEWRAPKVVYRPATETEKFNAALQQQRRK